MIHVRILMIFDSGFDDFVVVGCICWVGQVIMQSYEECNWDSVNFFEIDKRDSIAMIVFFVCAITSIVILLELIVFEDLSIMNDLFKGSSTSSSFIGNISSGRLIPFSN